MIRTAKRGMEFHCIGAFFKFPPTSEVSHACVPTYHDKHYETAASSVLREKAAKKKRDSRAEPDGKVEDKSEWKKGMTGEKEKQRRNYRKNYSRNAIVRIATEKQQLPSRIVECLLYYNSYVRFVRSVCEYAYVTARIDTWSVWIVRGQRCTREIESEMNGNWNCNYYSRVIIMYSMHT